MWRSNTTIITGVQHLNFTLSIHPEFSLEQLRVDKYNRLVFDDTRVRRYFDFRSAAKKADAQRFHNWQVGVAVNLLFKKEGLTGYLGNDDNEASKLDAIRFAVDDKVIPNFQTVKYTKKRGCALDSICHFYRQLESHKGKQLTYDKDEVYLGHKKERFTPDKEIFTQDEERFTQDDYKTQFLQRAYSWSSDLDAVPPTNMKDVINDLADDPTFRPATGHYLSDEEVIAGKCIESIWVNDRG